MKNLDIEEHFFLALNAISDGSHDRAIEHLKEVVSGEYYGKAQYLLGAEYAEIGMYDRAKQFFKLAVKEESIKEIVMLQTGLLHIFLNEKDDAKLCFKSLINDGEESDPVYWFAKGMDASIDAKNQEAIELLSKGIELNKTNNPLNNDMQKYISYLSQIERQDEKSSESADPKTKLYETNNKFLLTNYKNDEL